jgi:hypothetical protein
MTDYLTHTQLEELKTNIEDGIEQLSIKLHPSEHRNHLGISEIGEECKAKLYFKFRWVSLEQHEGWIRRLFARGHREEERYINYLEGIGCTIYRTTPEGKRLRVSGVMGHYGGELDLIIKTPWYHEIPFLTEFKTHNAKSFAHYVDKGLQISKPKHYDQMCGYGEKLQIQYGLYFSENKNDDDIQVTPIKLDWERGKALEKKAAEIILATERPPKISENSAYYECKTCFARDICHNEAIPEKNCRSCKNSRATENATWTCNKFGLIPPDFIKIGCSEWMPI